MAKGQASGEWWFYHLEQTSLEKALGPLLEKCLERQWRVLIVANEQRLPVLDTALWTWKDDSFLPHGRSGDADSDQPILLASTADPTNGAQVVVLLDGASADAEKFERCMVMFDGGDAQTRGVARKQYKAAKDAGQAVRYFQQNDGGGWVEQK